MSSEGSDTAVTARGGASSNAMRRNTRGRASGAGGGGGVIPLGGARMLPRNAGRRGKLSESIEVDTLAADRPRRARFCGRKSKIKRSYYRDSGRRPSGRTAPFQVARARAGARDDNVIILQIIRRARVVKTANAPRRRSMLQDVNAQIWSRGAVEWAWAFAGKHAHHRV